MVAAPVRSRGGVTSLGVVAVPLRAEDDRQFGQAAQYQPVAVAPAQRRPGGRPAAWWGSGRAGW